MHRGIPTSIAALGRLQLGGFLSSWRWEFAFTSFFSHYHPVEEVSGSLSYYFLANTIPISPALTHTAPLFSEISQVFTTFLNFLPLPLHDLPFFA